MTAQHTPSAHPTSVPPSARPPRRRPFFIAAAAVFITSLVAAGTWSVLGLLAAWHAPDDFARTHLPGSVSVSVTDSGIQYLYLEHADGSAVPSLNELGVTVTGPDGQEATVESTDLTMEYDAHAGDLGTAFGTFQATDGGTYVATATADEPGTSLAVGKSVAGALLVPLAGAAGLVGIGLVAGTALVVVGLRRS